MASKKPGNEGGIKSLFAQHVEKMALGVAVVMVFVLLYLGMRHKPLPSDREAAALERDVKTATDHVQMRTWDRAWRLKEWPEPVYEEKALEDAVNVDPKAYQVSWLDPPKVRTLNPRVDPRLMPVEKLEVRPGVIAALAVTADGAGDVGFQPPRRLRGGADLIEDDEESDSGPPTLRDEQIDTLDKGFRPKGRGGARAVGRAFVAIRGIVPIVDQGAEYDRCFARAMKDDNYGKSSADRDRPEYIYAYIERQEVGADGKPVAVGTKDGEPQYWKRMFMSAKIGAKAAEPWPEVEEPADPRYLDDNLTMRPLPVLLQDYVSLVMHPDIPFKPEEKKKGEEQGSAAHGVEVPGDDPGFDPGGPGETGGPEEIDQAAGGPRNGADASKATEKPAEYRLLRYYDFSVDPAKRYRYRVRLLLQDPNNPQEPTLAPDPSTLEGDVIARIEAANKAAGRRVFWRETDWSEETAIVDFPPTRRILAGKVTPARYDVLGPRAKIFRKGPLATVMALVWDAGQAVWVPGIVNELNLGSVVNFSKNVWVVDPLLLDGELRRLPAYPFETGFTVADIYGGEMLPSGNRKSKLTVPGEVLLVGEDGSVSVRSEFDDADTFSLFHYTSDGEGSSGGSKKSHGGSPHSVDDNDIL